MCPVRRAPRRLLSLVALAATAAGAGLVGGCGGAEAGSTQGFCDELSERADAIMNPQITTQDDADDYVGMYRDLAGRAPLAIEEDWDVLVRMYESVASVPAGDVAAADEARRSVYAAYASGEAVRGWVAANCGLDLATVGPVATTVAAATTTTLAGG